MIRWPRGVDGLCFGGDYNPEQWPEEIWAQDAALMREAGVNLVSLGVFAWSRIEPTEGKYELDWLDRVFDLLDQNGVKIALATPTASPPPWFGLAYPDALPESASGARVWHGSRDAYCMSAPAYQAAALRIADTLAQRYADHPALAMWHVHNEYGTACHCDHVAAAFRRWLEARHGTLDQLNDAWTTAFWSQHYTDWSQILPMRKTQYLPNPSQSLDFRRFVSDELLASFCAQRDVLRAANPEIPITTNHPLGGWVPVNPRDWAAETDLVAIDHYSSSLDAAEHESAFAADQARSWAGGRPWLLMEQALGAVSDHRRRVAPKAPGAMARHSLSHVARGSRGAMFFQWRQSRSGAEMFHPAAIPHAGPDSRIFRETTELGAVLGKLGEVDAGRSVADVAVLWDTESWWALQVDDMPSRSIDYLDEVRAAHRALWRAGVPVDLAHPDDDLTGYTLVVAPALYLLSDQAAAALTAYVEEGGNLVVSYLSGIADPHHRVRLGGYPGALRDLLGIRVEEFHPLAEGSTVELSTGDAGRLWSEHMHVAADVTVLARYAGSGALAGLPAVTRRRVGGGIASYLSTRLDDDAYGQLLLEALGRQPDPAAAPGVEVIERRDGETSWWFVLNHTDQPCSVPVGGVDLVTGENVDPHQSVPAGGFAVVRERSGDLGRFGTNIGA
jgi:beta-galactosidase